MSASQDLYAELKSDIAALVEPLFDFSEKCLRERGNFLPHAAVLLAQRESDRDVLSARIPNTDRG
jgi:hypothetical protein